MDRHRPEIEDLDSRPDHIIRPQRGEIDVLEFFEYGPLPSALGNGHECEEDTEADGREDELVHRHTLHGGDGAAGLGDGEGAGKEAEPLELEGGHEESVGHESGQTFEVEWWWSVGGGGDEGAEGGGLFFEVCELDGD